MNKKRISLSLVLLLSVAQTYTIAPALLLGVAAGTAVKGAFVALAAAKAVTGKMFDSSVNFSQNLADQAWNQSLVTDKASDVVTDVVETIIAPVEQDVAAQVVETVATTSAQKSSSLVEMGLFAIKSAVVNGSVVVKNAASSAVNATKTGFNTAAHYAYDQMLPAAQAQCAIAKGSVQGAVHAVKEHPYITSLAVLTTVGVVSWVRYNYTITRKGGFLVFTPKTKKDSTIVSAA